MCITDGHDMTLAVKVTLNPNTADQPTNQESCYHMVIRQEENCLKRTISPKVSLRNLLSLSWFDTFLQMHLHQFSLNIIHKYVHALHWMEIHNTIWLATRQMRHSNICVSCRLG